MEKKAKGGDKDSKEAFELVERCLAALREGRPARTSIPFPRDSPNYERLGGTGV